MEFIAQSPISVLDALRTLYPDSSRRTLQNWLKAGRFTLGGKRLERDGMILQPGEKLVSKETFAPPRVPGLRVIYEDRYLIAIDKPVGLLSVPLDGDISRRHALGLLRKHFDTQQIFAVHRIDRETSGVLLFARGKQSAEKLGELFERHDLQREYVAIVEGRLREEAGTWEYPLLELPNLDIVVSSEGKNAVTHFKVIRRSAKFTYLQLTLETGKKHQIRVHCKQAGHPVVGDIRYGALENPIRRLCLHAIRLELVHPFTKKKVLFESPVPAAFQVLGGRQNLPSKR